MALHQSANSTESSREDFKVEVAELADAYHPYILEQEGASSAHHSEPSNEENKF